MKIMVISDTHGRLDKVIKQYNQNKDIQKIIHLGDYYKDAQKIKKLVDVEVIAVKGNLDNGFNETPNKIIQIAGHSIYLTHGHLEDVKSGLTKLYYKSLSSSCDIALFGHTHIPTKFQSEEIMLLNPGSLTVPRGGSRPSFALLNFEENGKYYAEHIYPDS